MVRTIFHRKLNLNCKFFVLFITIIFSGGIIYFHSNTFIQCLAFFLLTGVAVVLVDFDLLHPYTWFSGVFSLYSLSYPILNMTNNLSATLISRFGYSEKLIWYEWIALSTFLLCCSPKKISFIPKYSKKYMTDSNWMFGLFMVLIIGIATWHLHNSNFIHKNEIYASGSALYKIAFIAIYLLLVWYVFFLLTYYQTIWKYFLIITVGSSSFFIAMFSGERDILFMFLLLTVLIFYIKKTITKKHLFFIVPFGLALIPISAIFKASFLTRKVNVHQNGTKNIIPLLLNSEFRSASQNLQAIIANDEKTENLFGLNQIINDVIRVFKSNTPSTQHWYNDFFWSMSDTKYGFSLVAEGYLIAKIIGIIIIFIIVGFCIGSMYKYSIRNQYFMCAYICSIPQFMYAIRADLTNFFSPILKHIIFTLVIIYLLEKIIVNPVYMEVINERIQAKFGKFTQYRSHFKRINH